MKESMFSSSVPPPPVQITAVEKDTNTSTTLNSQTSLSVQPTETKEIVTINIGEGMFNLVHPAKTAMETQSNYLE